MAERVPEFALLIGVFLGLSATVSAAVLTGTLFRPLLFGVVVCYPFAAFGVLRSDDPSEALPPRYVLAIGAVLGLLTVVTALLERDTVDLVAGVFAATVVVLPPAAYAVRFDADVNPLSPVQTLGLCAAVGAGFVVSAPVTGSLAAVTGFLIALFGALYADARGYQLTRRHRRAGVVAGALLGVGVVALAVVTQLPLGPAITAGAVLVLTPSLFVALTRTRRRRTRT